MPLRILLFFVVGLLLSAALLLACGTNTTKRLGLPLLETVDTLEVARYLGTWYEIASYPQSFQKGCSNTTAAYTLREDGMIEVVNRCTRKDKEREARGRARVVDAAEPSKLQVSFFGPFWGDYWVIDLGQSYAYAVVGHPSRDYLWILSRTPSMSPAVYEGILARLEAKNYDLSRLRITHQDAASDAPSPE